MRGLITGSTGMIGAKICAHLIAQGWELFTPSHKDMWIENATYVHRYVGGLPEFDLLVCAHGVYGEVAPVEQSDSEIWREAILVNLVGTYNICRQSLRKMKTGLIVNIAGGGGMLDPLPLLASYACSKSGIVSLTRTLAAELRGRIRANAIFPGMQDSKIHDFLLAAGPELNPHYDAIKAMRDTGAGAIPVERTLAIIDRLLGNQETGRVYFARTGESA